jgi:hypothetical protein
MASQKLLDALAGLQAADADLKNELDAILADDAARTKTVAQQVTDALAAEGATEDSIAATIADVTATLATGSAQIKALLTPAQPGDGGVVGQLGVLTVSPPSITSAAGTGITVALQVTGGTPPYTFSCDLADVTVVDGSAAGDGSTLNVSGTPAATEDGTIRVNDSATPAGLFKVPVAITA